LIQRAALSLFTELRGKCRYFKAVDFITAHSKLFNHNPDANNNIVAAMACSADALRILAAISAV